MASPGYFAPVIYDDCEQCTVAQLPATACSDTACSCGSAFSHRSLSSALSFSSTTFGTDTSLSDMGGSRRGSMMSANLSMADGSKYTPTRYQSPMVPMEPRSSCWPAIYEALPKDVATFSQINWQATPGTGYEFRQPCPSDSKDFWTSTASPSYVSHARSRDMSLATTQLDLQSSYASPFFVHDMNEPVTTRSFMFGEGYPTSRSAASSFSMEPMRTHTTAELDTIAPQATFHTVPMTLPISTVEPQTPTRCVRNNNYNCTLSSSPDGILTPVSLSNYTDGGDEWTLARSGDWMILNNGSPKSKSQPDKQTRLLRSVRKARRSVDRIERRLVQPDGRTKLVLDSCDVDRKNTFHCSYPNCLQNGKQKSFRRAEHRKRHEMTVHGDEDDDHKAFRCRFCDRGFNRNDNLKQHYTTHANKSRTRRNEWVAVLDPSSSFYDPEYVGSVTRDGYPIRDNMAILRCPKKACIDVFYTTEALQIHESKKQHRNTGAGKVPQSGSPKDSD